MSQSVKHSWIEAVATTLVSTFGTYLVQWIIYPLMGIEADNGQLWIISLIFGAFNTIKTFVVRRIFDKLERRGGEE